MIRGRVIPRKTNERVAFLKQIPYITYTPNPGFRCMSWTGGFSSRAVCQNPAEWHYTAGRTKKAHAASGSFCWVHLFRDAIFSKVYDSQRFERAQMKINGITKE